MPFRLPLTFFSQLLLIAHLKCKTFYVNSRFIFLLIIQSDAERARGEAAALQEKLEKSQGEVYRLKAKLENAQGEQESIKQEMERSQTGIQRIVSERDKVNVYYHMSKQQINTLHVRINEFYSQPQKTDTAIHFFHNITILIAHCDEC